MDKKNLAFDKVNFILLAIGMAVVILGFILMSGSGSTEQAFNPEVFSTMNKGCSGSLFRRFCVDYLRNHP